MRCRRPDGMRPAPAVRFSWRRPCMGSNVLSFFPNGRDIRGPVCCVGKGWFPEPFHARYRSSALWKMPFFSFRDSRGVFMMAACVDGRCFPRFGFFSGKTVSSGSPGGGQAADSGMSVRLVLAGRLYETLATFPVPAVCSCRKDVSDSVCVSTFSRRESALFGERLPVVTGVGFRSECLCSVRAAMSRLATCPDACFSGLFPPRDGIGKSRDGLSGYRQAGCLCHRAKSCAIKRARLAFRHFSVFGQGMFGEVVYAGRSRVSGCPGACFSGSGLKVFCGKNDLDIEPSNAHCIVSSTVCFYHRATNV